LGWGRGRAPEPELLRDLRPSVIVAQLRLDLSQAEAAAVDLQDVAVVEQAIEDGGGQHLAADRRFGFDLERAAFALALQRLCEAGSDLAGSQWLATVEAPSLEPIRLQHLYRTVGFLAEARGELERELHLRDRDLFSQELDLVFIDTTSTFLWRDEESLLVRRGHSRDRRPDQPQVVLCVAVDRSGFPVAWDILPGNTADATAFAAMITQLRKRLRIRRVIVVADRGMISAASIRLLTDSKEAPFDYMTIGSRLPNHLLNDGSVVGMRAGSSNVPSSPITTTSLDFVCRSMPQCSTVGLLSSLGLEPVTFGGQLATPRHWRPTYLSNQAPIGAMWSSADSPTISTGKCANTEDRHDRWAWHQYEP
jgi:hypothetical protein